MYHLQGEGRGVSDIHQHDRRETRLGVFGSSPVTRIVVCELGGYRKRNERAKHEKPYTQPVQHTTGLEKY